MLSLILLIYVGVRIDAAWWFYLLIAQGVCLKIWAALVQTSKTEGNE